MMLLAEIPPRTCFVPVEAWFKTVIYYLSSNRGFEKGDALLQAFLTPFFCSALILCSVAPDIQETVWQRDVCPEIPVNETGVGS